MGIRSIRRRALDGEILVGTWLVLGSSLTAEIAGNSGFDWVVLDMEHGMGANDSLLYQLQALSGTPASPLSLVLTSSGISPRNSSPNSSAVARAPP